MANADDKKLTDRGALLSTKRFITSVSLQTEGNLRKLVYYPKDNSSLFYEHECYFPIVPVIATSIQDGEHFVLSYIKAHGMSANQNKALDHNFQCLLDDIEQIKSNLGIDFKYDIEEIPATYDASNEDLNKLVKRIVAAVKPGDILYVCTTYGEKTDTIALQQALMEIHTNNPLDVDIEVCIYGYIIYNPDKPNQTGEIKDVTNFVFRRAKNYDEAHEESEEQESEKYAESKHYLTYISPNPIIGPAQYRDESGELDIYQPVVHPIIFCIDESVEDGDEITIDIIVFDSEDQKVSSAMTDNPEKLANELSALQEHKHEQGIDFGWTFADPIRTPYDSNNEDLNQLINHIKKRIQYANEVYACMTFGQKTNCLALYQALLETEALYRGRVSVEKCIYGNFQVKKLKDVTEFVLRGASELAMRQLGVSDVSRLRNIITGDDEDFEGEW